MPTVTVHRDDVEKLLGQPFDADVFESLLELVKGELDDVDAATGEIRVELNDTNRPDLWCVEGICRQLRIHREQRPRDYAFFDATAPEALDMREIRIDPTVNEVRPYIGACIARGVVVDDKLLAQLIQTQEKICDVFGRKRKSIAIGIYAADKLQFPLHYRGVPPSEGAFVPLGMNEPLTLEQIATMHPKGQQYAPIVARHGLWPLLLDDAGTVLSFPPVINSTTVGEVREGDSELFLEVTGTDLRMVTLVVNILAANMADRGASIEPVRSVYPEATPFGRQVVTPRHLKRTMSVPCHAFFRALGETVSGADLQRELSAYGYRVENTADSVRVVVPPYRDDILHPVDVIEDFAISRGYEQFSPEMPSEFTVGGLLPLENLSDRVRDLMVGMGYQEVLSNILVGREELTDHMELHGAALVSVSNVMTASYSVLRNAVLPSLLKVEQQSGRAFYPHSLFEVGEVARMQADSPMGSETRTQMAVLLAHAEANFSELASRLEMLCFYLGISYQLEPVDHASYIPGRAGRIVVNRDAIGIIGELSPEVLENWKITVPCAAFELDLSALI
ncbi:MAG: phenylalanine--tRNA ligase subunit beta [Nitrospirota bacterium]|nr:phenylalanine--tRNA ligase subunit beta [Nitrospirota bacterium]